MEHTASTISKLVPTKLDLKVKRKTKSIANSSKSVRWFVLHGSESDLTILEHNWDKVHQQTLWSLQNCYMPKNSALSNEDSVNTPAANSLPHPSPTPLSTRSISGQQPVNNANQPTVSESPLLLANSPSHGSPFLDQDPHAPPSPPQKSTSPHN